MLLVAASCGSLQKSSGTLGAGKHTPHSGCEPALAQRRIGPSSARCAPQTASAPRNPDTPCRSRAHALSAGLDSSASTRRSLLVIPSHLATRSRSGLGLATGLSSKKLLSCSIVPFEIFVERRGKYLQSAAFLDRANRVIIPHLPSLPPCDESALARRPLFFVRVNRRAFRSGAGSSLASSRARYRPAQRGAAVPSRPSHSHTTGRCRQP